MLSQCLQAKLLACPGLCPPCLLALLLLGHFLTAVGAIVWLPMLLLVSQELSALLATLLPTSLLGCCCLVWSELAQIYNPTCCYPTKAPLSAAASGNTPLMPPRLPPPSGC